MTTLNAIPAIPVNPARPALQLFGWGTSDDGQLGMGPTIDLGQEYTKPKRNVWVENKIGEDAFGENEAGLEDIAAGGMHTLFIDESGTVWSCGVNDEGCLGRLTKDVPDPEKPDAFLSSEALSAEFHPVQALLDEGFRAVRIAAGDNISAAISSQGELRVWGSFRDSKGRLGFSKNSDQQFFPESILKFTSKPGSVEKCVDVAAGNNHLLVLTTHGNVYALGVGEEGQLGRKIIQRRKINGTVPEKIVFGTRSRKAVVIGAAGWHSFAVDEQGDVWGWGMNTMGQTGTGVRQLNIDDEVQSPQKVVGLSKEDLKGETVVEIVGGEHHTLFRTSDGKVYACGRSTSGQLGLAPSHPAFKDRRFPDFIPEPVRIEFPGDKAKKTMDPIVQVSSGMHNNLAVTAGGVLYAWGQQTVGVLGTGSEEDSPTPTVIVRKDGSWTAVKAACGGQHSLALLRRK